MTQVRRSLNSGHSVAAPAHGSPLHHHFPEQQRTAFQAFNSARLPECGHAGKAPARRSQGMSEGNEPTRVATTPAGSVLGLFAGKIF